MKIEIIVTRDDGSTITIGSNHEITIGSNYEISGDCLLVKSRIWDFRPDFPGLRALTQDEAWAASFLCAELGLRHLPICPANVNHLRAAVAYNEHRERRAKAGEPYLPDREAHLRGDGDAQFSD